MQILIKYGILQTEAKVNMQNKTVECYKLSKNYEPNQKIEIPTYEMIRGREGGEARSGQLNASFVDDLHIDSKKAASLPNCNNGCRTASLPSAPSTPTLPSLPSLPNNNNIITNKKIEVEGEDFEEC